MSELLQKTVFKQTVLIIGKMVVGGWAGVVENRRVLPTETIFKNGFRRAQRVVGGWVGSDTYGRRNHKNKKTQTIDS